MDEFERQIRQGRAEMDRVENLDADSLWTGIDERMAAQHSGSRLRVYQRWLVAASLLALVSLGVAFVGWQNREVVPTTLSDLSPELARQEAAFQTTIALKKKALKINELDQEAYAPFFEELSLLDSLQVEYQRELPKYSGNDRLLNSLIRYYELKIQILEQLENDLAKQQYYGIPNQPLEI